MGRHLIFEGNKTACSMYLPYALRQLEKIKALPGEAHQKVTSLGRGNFIRLRHDKVNDFVHIKVGLHDGYEFYTMVDNPTEQTADDSTYLYQLINFERDAAGDLGKIVGLDRAGNPLNPAETPGQSHTWMLSVRDYNAATGTYDPISDEVPRDTHYTTFDATSRAVAQAMTITNPCGRRHFNQPFIDHLGLTHYLFFGNPNFRNGRDNPPKAIQSVGQVAGGMLLNGVFILPRYQSSQAVFEFISSKNQDSNATLQMPMPGWVTTNSAYHVHWIPSPDNDRMAAIVHHWAQDGDGYWKVYQGWMELSFTAGLDASGNLDGSQNIAWSRYLSGPGEHERYAAIGYDLSDQTNLKAVRFRAYLSNSYLAKTGAADPDSEGTEQSCRALAIYAEWFEIDGSNTPQTPTRTVLMWHGPFMGLLPTPGSPGPDDYSDEGGTYFNLWDVEIHSEAFEEAYGYPYYETNLLALDLRADAYALLRFMPDAGQMITGRWQTEHACFGDTPVVVDSGTPFSEPSLSLAGYTELTDSHGAWQRYLAELPHPGFVTWDGHKPFNWYIAALWHPNVSGNGPTTQHREQSYGGFALHPNGSWSAFIPNEFAFIQSVKATQVSQIYPPASMTIDAIHVKEWDSVGAQANLVFSTTHLDIYNAVRQATHTYGDEEAVQQVMGAATWGMNPEAYSNGQ